MKGSHRAHHHRKHRETGGVNDAEADLKDKPMRYTADSKVNEEAEREEENRGGRTKRKARKEGGKIDGMMAKCHAGRKPRKSGGAAENHPFTAAAKGTAPKGRTLDMEMDGN